MSRRIIIYCVMDAKCFQHPPWPCVGQSRAEISSFPGGCTHSWCAVCPPSCGRHCADHGQHQGQKSRVRAVCPGKDGEEHFYFSFKFGKGVNTKFPDLPKGQSNRKKLLFQSSQHSAFTLGYLVRAASNFFNVSPNARY